MTEDDLKPGTNVTHKKGGKYRIVGVGLHTETVKKMVVYQSRDDDRLWIRPLTMFLDPDRFTLDKEEAAQ